MNSNYKRASLALAIALAAVSLAAAACMLPASKKKPIPLEKISSEPERTAIYRHDGWTIARASLHNHTIYSDGCRTPEDLLELARMQGMAVLAYTDHREGVVCYGKMFCGDRGGVESVGYDVYYDHLDEIQETAASYGMIALKGVEVSPPYFRNYGRLPSLFLWGGANHFTVYAIEDPAVLEDMPTRDEIPLSPETEYDQGPYEEFVKYIHDAGGIVHCVHPEWTSDGWDGTVHSMTIPPIHNVRIPHITAFAALPESFEVVPRPGGPWDGVLAEYLVGMRERPVWVVGDADYHCGGSLANATTLLYMREFTEAEVYNCMKEGRMVALSGEAFQDSYVAEWRVGDGARVMSGEEVVVRGAPTVRFALDHPVAECETVLIRNGVAIKRTLGVELSFTDHDLAKTRSPAYYRVEVVGPIGDNRSFESPTIPESLLFTNPIFVRFK